MFDFVAGRRVERFEISGPGYDAVLELPNRGEWAQQGSETQEWKSAQETGTESAVTNYGYLGEYCAFVDAIQGLGAFPVDVRRARIHALAADGHKWLLGPEGCGILYIARELQAQVDAFTTMMKEVARYAEKYGVVVGLEDKISADDNNKLLDAIGSDYVAVYYDAHNIVSSVQNNDVYAEPKKLGKRISQIHVKNGNMLLSSPGGRIDWPRMAKEFSSRQTQFEQWDASDPNRKMALEETPWLQMAKGGDTNASDLINVLDARIAKAQRIQDELAIVVDAAQARACEEIIAQHFMPEGFHFRHFGKEAMPADIQAIAVEDFRARDAAHARSHLQHDRLDAGLCQFVRRRQARRSTTDDDDGLDVRI